MADGVRREDDRTVIVLDKLSSGSVQEFIFRSVNTQLLVGLDDLITAAIGANVPQADIVKARRLLPPCYMNSFPERDKK